MPAFSLFVTPSYSTHFPVEVYVSLCHALLARLLINKAPAPYAVSGVNSDDLSQDIIEKCFLPFPANTSSTEDNAKVSILVESLFRAFLKACPCYRSPSLGHAIQEGVKARENKAKGDKRRKGAKNTAVDSDLVWLKASGKRLMVLYTWVEQNALLESD